MPGGPEELPLQALNPEQRGYRVLIDIRGFMHAGIWLRQQGGCLTFTQTGMIKQVCRGQVIAKSRTRMSEINSSS